MTSDWVDIELGELVAIKHGFAFKGEHFVERATPYQLVTPGNFAIGGGFQAGKPKYYAGPVPDEYVLHRGDLIVTMTDLSRGADTLGYSAVVPAIEGTVWLHNQRVGLVQVKAPNLVLPGYLHFLMRTASYRHWVVASATGSTVKHTSPGRICAYRSKIPLLPTQQVICEVLNSLENRIALLRETNATLEAIGQALFKSWFIDFDPVRAKQQGLVPAGTGEAAASLFPDGTEPSALGSIPRGWQVQAVGDVVACVGGATPDTKELSYWEPEEHAWTTPKDLSGLPAPVLLTTERRLSTKGLARIGSGLLPEGTLLMSSRAPIGYLAITRMRVAINQGYIAMTPGSLLPPLYMLYWCRHNMEGIKARANGSTFMEISKKAFRPIPILVPPADVVDAFMTMASPLFDRLVENARQVQTLAALRDTLLPRLISGQLRLPEAEAALAET